MYFASKDGKYHTSVNYVKFKDGEEPEEMWFVDAHTEKDYVMDEDFFSDYDDAVSTFEDWKSDIMKYNFKLNLICHSILPI